MTLPTDYVDGDVLTAADVNAITTAVNGNIPASIIAAKGDLLVGLTNDSVGVLTAGTNGFLLSASSGSSTGLAWTSAGGKLLKVAYATSSTASETTSLTMVDSSLSITFTPVSASSYLIVQAVFTGGWSESTANIALKLVDFRIRNTTSSTTLDDTEIRHVTGSNSTDPTGVLQTVCLQGVQASSSTSSRTFKVQHATINTNLPNLIRSGSLIVVYEVEI